MEAAGVGYVGQLWQWLSPSQRGRVNDDLAGLPARLRPVCRPQLVGQVLMLANHQRMLHCAMQRLASRPRHVRLPACPLPAQHTPTPGPAQ